MTNLNALIPPGSGWDLKSAADINEPGQIVSYGKINGEIHGLLLTPTCPGDIDGDGDVDLAELSALLAVCGTTCD